jgi:UDP-3-O-[3-hydroxymyristoyl] N-acetylglucosamine deacetylase
MDQAKIRSIPYTESTMSLLQTLSATRVEPTNFRKPGPRQQRTLARVAEILGVGMVTGNNVKLRFCPTEAGTGISFQRTDLPGAPPIPAKVESVTGTARRTTLGEGRNQVTLVEHVLAALAGMRIDNCTVELNGIEPPGLDGSSEGYVETLVEAGISLQSEQRKTVVVSDPIIVSHGGATLSVFPREGDDLVISYLLDYGPYAPIAPQSHTEVLTPARFRHELARCRTFVLEREAIELQKQGIGRHLNASELLVFGPKGLIDNRLRFPDEPARHKILDVVGDLALTGFDIVGHVVAYRSGHPLNVELARSLTQYAHRKASGN